MFLQELTPQGDARLPSFVEVDVPQGSAGIEITSDVLQRVNEVYQQRVTEILSRESENWITRTVQEGMLPTPEGFENNRSNDYYLRREKRTLFIEGRRRTTGEIVFTSKIERNGNVVALIETNNFGQQAVMSAYRRGRSKAAK